MSENGAGNGKPPERRLSGFASPEHWTEERREAQREWARRAHAEGRFGGRQPGAGRPKTKTVSEVVSEKAQEKGEKIAKKLIDLVDHKSPSIALGAIDRINTFEQNVQKNMREDERELLKLHGKNLDSALSEALAEVGIQYDFELPESEIQEIESGNGDR